MSSYVGFLQEICSVRLLDVLLRVLSVGLWGEVGGRGRPTVLVSDVFSS